MPRQQLFELVGRVLGDAGEDVSEPGLRINVVQFARHNQAIHHRGALSAAIGADEQPRFTS